MGPLFAWFVIALSAPLFELANPFPPIIGLFALAGVATYLPPDKLRLSLPRWQQLAWAGALLAVASNLVRIPSLLDTSHGFSSTNLVMAAAFGVLLLAVLAAAPPLRSHFGARTATGVLVVAAAASTVGLAALILGTPDPKVDVFYFLNEGARGFIHGLNPYQMQFTPLPRDSVGYQDPAYFFDVYSYLPGMLLLSLPTVPFGDVRWLMVLSVPLSAFFLRRILTLRAVNGSVTDALVLAFLAYPGLLWVVREAWTEPLIVCAFLGALWALLDGRWWWGVVFTTVFLSIKQYTPLLLLPLWGLGLSIRAMLASAAVVAALCLPFFLWSPRDFWWDAFYYQVQAPARIDAFSLNGLLLAEWGASLPGWLTLGAPLLGAGYAVWRGLRGADLPTMLRLAAGAYFLLFLFNKFAFANYYFMLQAVLLVAAGTLCPQAHPATSPTPIPTRHPRIMPGLTPHQASGG